MKEELCAGLLILATVPAAAQYDDDEQTRDYEEMDRRYYERYTEKETDPEVPATAEQTIEAFLARADELIRDRNYRSSQGERYRVQSDDPRVDAGAAVSLLEGFRDFFDRFWSGRAELRDYDETSRAFLFHSFHKFNQVLAGDFRFSEIRPKGHYGWLFDVITLHTDPDGGGELADTLVHEAAHQLVDRRIFGDGALPSIWVSEGLASYFGYTYRDEDGRFVPGEVGGKSARLRHGPGSGGPSESALRLKAFRKALRSASDDEGPLVARVIEIDDPGAFYSADPALHYSASWLLVHFLLHGEDGRHAEAFGRYLRLETEGRGGPDALFGELGLEPATLQAAVERHVKRLKPR